ncbi:MAG: mannose-1-phosphate guanylyltransferase/mannose-6-phosphate isomerase, partial [Magnetococcales bacterium]|nr:mannose-1-phosphate guanylyltransferase/mannose-6-phosphate isomerase [Magnetococcales bacterium]
MLIPVILSGGSGTRLWPLSRQAYPKQFLTLFGEHSLFQDTLLRLRGVPDCGTPILVCNEQHRYLVAEQLRLLGIDDARILLEPMGRNTAPAAACAAFAALGEDPQALLLVLPADHLIRDLPALHRALAAGRQAAEQGHLVTFGILPNRAETGFGYVKRGSILREWPADDPLAPGQTLYAVQAFVEKPDQETAQAYLESGEYYWNSGMFLFRADRFLQELRHFTPETWEKCQLALAQAKSTFDFTLLESTAFAATPKDSIDYSIMEKTTASVLVPLEAGWNDVGTWSALWEEGEQDADGNVLQGDLLVKEVHQSFIRSESRLVTAIGLDHLVIVETADAILVANKERVQDIKSFVNQLQNQGRDEAVVHRTVYRPWGSYECIDRAPRFQVKRIVVSPGAKLSLQLHHHRAEHWIVVRGTAQVTKGSEVFLLREDESTYIPLGVQHRLANPGRIPLELIEVQSGSYLGEDDIMRLEDHYGRIAQSED